MKMRMTRFVLVIAALFMLTVGAAAAAPQPYVVAVKVTANHACDSQAGWEPLSGSRVTIIREDGSRDPIYPNPTKKVKVVGEVTLTIEYPAGILPCNRPWVIVSPPVGGDSTTLEFEVGPPPPVVGTILIPTVEVEFRAVELQREN